MLIRSTWTLTVAESTTVPRAFGLELVKFLHRHMGLEMGEEIPSLSCSGLLGAYSTAKEVITFHPDTFYQLTLCGLQEQSAKAIAALEFDNASTDTQFFKLLGATFTILDRQDDTTNYETLYHTLIASEPFPTRRFDLQFLTPTAFSQDRVYLPLPVPNLMFRSWLERWNQFAPVYLGEDELINYLTHAVALSRHRINTRTFTVHRGNITGFTGEISLQILAHVDPLLSNVANLLIHYAQFTGTGIKTRLGMGQTKIRLPEV
jgi:CRISPR-associated endoribonuclease Cas6